MASKSVNVPTNQKIKEKDINAKLQLYGIYAGVLLHRATTSRAPPAIALPNANME
jgi:hypothetical protein